MPAIKLRENEEYYWYKLHKIHTNFYDNSGKTLHGSYQKKKVKTLELLEKGTFYYGLKDGLWKEWYLNGNLNKIENWKIGILHGKFKTFNEKGEKLINGRYKKGKKDGVWIDYQSKDTLTYSKGNIKEIKLKSKKKKSLKEFFQSIFRKKNTSAKSKPVKNKKNSVKKKSNTKKKTTSKKNRTKTKN